jgi:uncharacterized protein YdaU (DUF1376 family)
MKRLLILESERKKILSMHNALKEQTARATGEISPDHNILRKAINAGCLKNGKILTNKDMTKYVYRATTKSGKQVDFFGDMTYKLSDGKVSKWKCDKIAEMEASAAAAAASEAETQSKIQSLKNQGWKTIEDLKNENENTNPSEIQKRFDTMQVGNVTLYKLKIIGQEQKYDTQKIKDYIVGLGYIVDPDDITLAQGGLTPYSLKDKLGIDPTKYGLPADYKIYKEPSGQNVQSRINPVRQDIERQEIRRKDCKEVIDTFYDFYKLDPRGARTVDEKTSSLKPDVQSCVYQHYPTKLFGRNFNRKVEELAGLSSFTPQGKKYKIELP